MAARACQKQSGIVLVVVQNTVHHRLLEVDGAAVVHDPSAVGVIDRREVDFRLAPPADVEAAAEARRVAGDGGVVDRQGGARGVDAAAIDAWRSCW